MRFKFFSQIVISMAFSIPKLIMRLLLDNVRKRDRFWKTVKFVNIIKLLFVMIIEIIFLIKCNYVYMVSNAYALKPRNPSFSLSLSLFF